MRQAVYLRRETDARSGDRLRHAAPLAIVSSATTSSMLLAWNQVSASGCLSGPTLSRIRYRR